MTSPDITLTTGAETAARLDAADPLSGFRNEFRLPVGRDGSPQTYLAGHSLGAVPRAAAGHVNAELERWAGLGVAGHFDGEAAWVGYHELLAASLERLVGGRPGEVVAMNSLTVNLHLLMVSFYEPTKRRYKVLIEAGAFPSDHFAVESQIRQRGHDPAESLILARPRGGEETLRSDDLLALIAEHGAELALVVLPGVQYYTGQVLPMAEITAAAHATGARVGFDLAHAVGNIPLALHDWNVDFAAWCSYKYLNGGPGGIGGAFVHGRHVADGSLPKLLGWWGQRPDIRFEMGTFFDPIPTAESWQLSNPPILAMAPLRASLEIFDRAGGLEPLRAKSQRQLAYLDFLLTEVIGDRAESLTPTALAERGCQASLRIRTPGVDGRAVHQGLQAADVACDWRYPDVIRVAPVPLYNTFGDIHRFVNILDRVLDEVG
ncbi:MAG: kynureninase [bacterium]|nr:kynureninase [bacterium]MXV90782.1 kynureninase [Acidimicrobiia bacterium]MYC44924.1 kynureninase [Acidimicrobiia bacterium]